MYEADPQTQVWLADFLATQDGVAGTVHIRHGDALALAAAHNIPDKVIAVTRSIPHGRGMAGLAWARKQAVMTCDLPTDTSGDVRPGAKAVDAKAAVALPVFDHHGEVVAVVGIAWADNRELDPEKIGALTEAAASVIR